MSDQLATMIANLEAKTGRSLEQWVAVVETSGHRKHGQIMAHLKGEHGLSHGYANLIAQTALSGGGGAGDPGDVVAAQYAGKEHLRPIYDAILAAVADFGNDVEVAPKKAGVSLRRAKQFALVTPATKTRVDLGLNATGVPATARLKEATGMCTNKVAITSSAEVDDEVVGWLRQAYEAAAPRT
ncbi:MAG: DUF4287 domain-containing protein [Ornithinimicrobium sp.]